MDVQQSNDLKDEMVKSSSASVNSVTTTETTVDVDNNNSNNTNFRPDRSLFINARGIGAIRLPVPSSELEIPIYDADMNLVYVSTRERRSSGDAVLSSPKGGDLVSTTYSFGPGRNPVIKLLHPHHPPPYHEVVDGGDGSVAVIGKWTSRTTKFTLPNGKTFEWSYVRSKQADGKKRTLLVLHLVDASGEGSCARSGRRIAQLVRSSETRPEGSSKHSAGNGGELVLDADAVEWIDESVVVATCILMLKKEIDRRRLVQMAVIAGGGGGG